MRLSRALTSARSGRTWRTMSLFSTIIAARKRRTDTAPSPETEFDSHTDTPRGEAEDNVFNLLPPEPLDAPEPELPPEPKPQGRNRHPVDMTDLSRLSIDHDGRLYWDGKPVETHHRLSMSRRQIAGACFVGAFVVIGALGAALQGSAAARDWACRLGWSASTCVVPAAPQRRIDLPA
ncbi:MAG: hypothetical protein WCG92_20020 [Hyphomicrobiales bacterium]